MKNFFYSVVFIFMLLGCGGGGGHHNATNPPSNGTEGQKPSYKLLGNSYINGFVKKGINDGFASLMLDVDNDGIYNGANDKSFQTPLNNGKFQFENIPVFQNKPLKAKLSVNVNGYAPFQRVLTLHNEDVITIDASAALNKPIVKEVLRLDNLSQSAKLSSVVIFGIKKAQNGLKSFAKLTTLSALADENKKEFENGALSTYTLPLSEVPNNVKLIEASMQAFDSTKKEDLQNFPGEFKGKTNQGEVGLKSAAFDYFVLRDQNGEIIHLKKSKFQANVDLSNCAHIWTRHVTSEQDALIMSWGDYDPTTPEYEVPIWSNDNAQNTWQFVGIANYYHDENGTNHYFQVCVPNNWGIGYLNCDSPFMINRPKNICVNAIDNKGNKVSNLQINAQKSGAFFSATTNIDGKASLQIPDTNLNSWHFTYEHDYTNWEEFDIDSNNIKPSSTQGCDFDLNLTLQNPYPYDIEATIYLKNGKLAKNKNVYLEYSGDNPYYYYFQTRRTNNQGKVHFDVDKNTPYILSFHQTYTQVNVNGQREGNETRDSGTYVDVVLHEQNYPPLVVIWLGNENIVKGKTQNIRIIINAWDSLEDNVTLNWIKLDGNQISLSNKKVVSENGYFFEEGRYDISNLNEGNHTISVSVSDNLGAVKIKDKNFTIRTNQAPFIGSPIVLAKEDGKLYYVEENGSIIKPGVYKISFADIYDRDGDNFSVSAKVDGNDINFEGNFTINQGAHTLKIIAKDELNNTNEKTFSFEARNQEPIILRAGTLKAVINKKQSQIMHLFAYVKDPDGDGIKGVSLKLTDTNNTNHIYELSNRGNYWGKDLNISTFVAGVYKLEFLAQDKKNALSNPYDVNVTIINQNMPPMIVPPFENKTISTEQNATYTFNVIDMEGDRVNVECKIDNNRLNINQNGNSYSVTLSNLSEGNHTISCQATDSHGASSHSQAIVSVFNPSNQSVLKIHTPFPKVLVAIHNPNNQYALIDSTLTDDAGNGAINLPPNTHNVSFSLTFNPQTILPQSFIFKNTKNKIISRAFENCENENESNNSNCQSANWCTILNSNRVPTWVVDVASLWIGDHKLTGSELDDNNDSMITSDELYTHMLALLDSNKDGAISWNELKQRVYAIDTVLYKNMPVGEYKVYVGPYYEDKDELEELHKCINSQSIAFNFSVNNLDDNITSVRIDGSAFKENAFLENQTSYQTQILALYPDKAGKYDFLVLFKQNWDNPIKAKLLLDLTPNDLIDGINLDYNTLQSENFAQTTIHYTNKIPIGILNAYRNGLSIGEITFSIMQNEPQIVTNDDEMNVTLRVIDNSNLTYALFLKSYDSDVNYDKWYEQEGYYEDGTLKSFYDTNNYPMLDIDADFNVSKKAFEINGSETNKVNLWAIGYSIENKEEDEVLMFNVVSFDLLSNEVGFSDINITKFYPNDIASQLQQAASNLKNTYVWLYVKELKGKNKNESIEYFQNEGVKNIWFHLYQPWPYRDFYFSKNLNSANIFKPSANVKDKKTRKKPYINPFMIPMPQIFR